MRTFDLIVALDQDNGIGLNNQLPWHFKADLAYFKQITTATTSAEIITRAVQKGHQARRANTSQRSLAPLNEHGECAQQHSMMAFLDSPVQNAVIMGKNTWLSLPEKVRPLPQRLNLVLSQNPIPHLPENVLSATSLDNALELLAHQAEQIFVIGGAQLYRTALQHPACQHLYITRIQHKFTCDTFFPPFEQNFTKLTTSAPQTEHEITFTFEKYARNKVAKRHTMY